MRGNGEGKKGEWPHVIKKREIWEGGDKDGVLCWCKGVLKREGKRERRKRERTKSHGDKKGGEIRGLFRGARKRVTAIISKRRLLVISAPGKSIVFNTNFKALENYKILWFHEKAMREKGHRNRRMITGRR